LDSADGDRIANREMRVLGGAPRIDPLTDDAAVERAIRITQEVRKAVGSTKPVTAADVPEFMTTMLRHPDLFQRIADLSMQTQGKGALAPRDRQLAILRVTWLCQAPYAWGEHVKHSRRIGITRDEIERVTLGSSAPGWTSEDSAILRAVEELHEEAMISDGTWAALSARLDERQLIELPVLVGQFTMVPYVQNTLRMRLDKDNVGLRAR